MSRLQQILCQISGASSIEFGEQIQEVWSGYGVVQRVQLRNAVVSNAVLKRINLNQARVNHRGWGGDFAHQRKLRSYRVEKAFYEHHASRCNESCRVPTLIGLHEEAADGELILVLEDLDEAGFDCRKSSVDEQEIYACLRWLANFHATFLHSDGDGLWPTGTYWHLATRPAEYKAMEDGVLKQAATDLDTCLNEATFRTLLHGDAKIANFCFRARGRPQVAAVDFQYTGLGCGMKDVAYLFSSCLTSHRATKLADQLLAFYFEQLQAALYARQVDLEFRRLEREWRELYPLAWADFSRFLAGWSPQHWKLNDYSRRMTEIALTHIARRKGHQ